jgi:tetratricopeptide (TPR) repeat protein
VKKLLFLCFLILPLVAKETQLYESGPNVIFHYDHLSKKEKEIALQVDFNNAVFYLEQDQYLKAIKLFKRTATILKVPSFLNIGIAYYKLNSINNAYLYLKKIYDIKEAANFDTYSYLSASYYLYQITKDRKYITTS